MRQYMGWYHPQSVVSFWSWVYKEWNFVNANKKREVGLRILGFEWVWLYEIPMGELRF